MKNLKAFLFQILFCSIFIILSNHSYAKDYKTNEQTCYGYPRVSSLVTSDDTCVGLVADESQISWSLPRKILFVDESIAIVTAFGGWDVNKGQVWKIKFTGLGRFQSQLLFKNTDRTHGLALGPDGYVYVGDASQILKFDPSLAQPKLISVVNNLPTQFKLKNGTRFNSNHPLTEFIFIENGDLLVNIGAPSNDCSEEYKTYGVCSQRDEQAELRRYFYNPSQQNFSPTYKVVARGLRNSMGLLYNPKLNLVYQAENAADQPGTPDEFNILSLSTNDVQDFGWPFCSGFGERYSGYQNFKSFCSKKAIQPLFLFPAHAAPLDMIYYEGQMFPELESSILVSWHGHRPIGSRIAIYPTDNNQHPLQKNLSFSTEQNTKFLFEGWQKDPLDRHPKGRPVGLDFNAEGAIFIMDDKNQSLLVYAKTKTVSRQDRQAPGGVKLNLEELNKKLSEEQKRNWDQLFTKSFIKTDCQSCHGDIIVNSSPIISLLNMTNNDWLDLNNNNLDQQKLWIRMTGSNGERIMPPAPSPNILDHKTDAASAYNLLKSWISTL